METDSLNARFKLGQDLKSLEKDKKNDIDTRKCEDFNCLQKSSSTMEESHSGEEERMQWKFEQEEYVCCVCGLKGSRLLDYYSCCNEQLAHRYCALKETKEAAADETIDNESLEAKVINDESLDANDMSVELSELFKELRETQTSVIDHFILKKHK